MKKGRGAFISPASKRPEIKSKKFKKLFSSAKLKPMCRNRYLKTYRQKIHDIFRARWQLFRGNHQIISVLEIEKGRFRK